MSYIIDINTEARADSCSGLRTGTNDREISQLDKEIADYYQESTRDFPSYESDRTCNVDVRISCFPFAYISHFVQSIIYPSKKENTDHLISFVNRALFANKLDEFEYLIGVAERYGHIQDLDVIKSSLETMEDWYLRKRLLVILFRHELPTIQHLAIQKILTRLKGNYQYDTFLRLCAGISTLCEAVEHQYANNLNKDNFLKIWEFASLNNRPILLRACKEFFSQELADLFPLGQIPTMLTRH